MRILAIDGGGIRGLIPALVLAEIERLTGRRTAGLFDLIAGTSTGAILACGLTRPGDDGGPAYSAADLAGLYESEGPEIFHPSLLVAAEGRAGDERWDDAGLTTALRRYLGAWALSQSLADVFVAAYDIERREPFMFSSARARADRTQDFPLLDVARAAAAAPTYFTPARVRDVAGAATRALIDGGLFASNPAMAALADARTPASPAPRLVVSLGTGEATRRLPFDRASEWGRAEWARPMLEVVFDGASRSADAVLRALLPSGRYVRLQTPLREASDALDDASDRNLEALRREAGRLIDRHRAELDRVAGILTA